MKEKSIVRLKKASWKNKLCGLYSGVSGIVMKDMQNGKSLVVFFNDKIVDDYASAVVPDSDLEIVDFEFPKELWNEIQSSNKFSEENLLKKQKFEKLKFEEYDYVELCVEDEEYASQGIHKGARGVVCIDYSVDGSILVDFTCVDKDGNVSGDDICVKLKDLKLIEKGSE